MTVHIDPSPKATGAQRMEEDPGETSDWLTSLGSLLRNTGAERVRYILAALDQRARNWVSCPRRCLILPIEIRYRCEAQPPYPGDIEMETRITAIIRWNAPAMVARANMAYGELGGDVARYASVAETFEVGFNHFFRAS